MKLRANRDLPSPRWLHLGVLVLAFGVAACPITGRSAAALGSSALHRVELFAAAAALLWAGARALFLAWHGRAFWLGRLPG